MEREWPNPDELMFRRVKREWSAETLLAQKGWFPLADVMKKLDPRETGKYRKTLKQREKLTRIGKNTIQIMGLKQFGNRIWADMNPFSRWYQQNEALWVSRIPKDWDFHTFLRQKGGVFSLNRVLQLLPNEWPIKYAAMRKLIAKANNARSEIGAERLEGAGYVIFMPEFGEWVRKQLSQ